MQYDYRKAVYDDVCEALENNYDIDNYFDFEGAEDFTDDDIISEARESLYEDLWVDDSVTGNGSGSYTFDRATAKEYVLNAIDGIVYEAFNEYSDFERLGKLFAEGDFEVIDVIVRTYLLGEMLDEWIEKNHVKLLIYVHNKRKEFEENS